MAVQKAKQEGTKPHFIKNLCVFFHGEALVSIHVNDAPNVHHTTNTGTDYVNLA